MMMPSLREILLEASVNALQKRYQQCIDLLLELEIPGRKFNELDPGLQFEILKARCGAMQSLREPWTCALGAMKPDDFLELLEQNSNETAEFCEFLNSDRFQKLLERDDVRELFKRFDINEIHKMMFGDNNE